MAQKPPENEPSQLETEVDKMMDPSQPDEPASAPELGADVSDTEDDPSDTSGDSETSPAEPDNAPSPLDDDKTDEAIDDINKSDSDEVLAAEDEKVKAPVEPPKKPNIFKRWWASKPWRYGSLIVLLALIIAALGVPTSRWWICNHLGVRAKVSLTVLDASTNLPLKNANVSLDGQTKVSAKDGQVIFTSVKLGQQKLTVTKPAFASANRELTVKFGTNNLGKIALKAVGIQYKIQLTDYLTGQPVAGAEVTSGQASALSNTNGQAVLTLMSVEKQLNISVKASDYNALTSEIDFSSGSASAKLVPAGRDYFVSNSTGTYDVDSVNLDGSDRQLVLVGTGQENSNISLAANPGAGLLALVSVRDNQRDVSGYQLQALTIINTKSKNTLTLDHADSFQLIGWLDGTTLVYVSVDDCSGQTCYNLMSYNYANSARKQLATTGDLAGIFTIGDRIYYATNDTSSTNPPQFVGVNSDGTNQQVLLKTSVYSIYRPSYSQLLLAAPGNWYSYQDGASQASQVQPPSNPTTSFYIDSPNGSQSAWLTQRDGQTALMIYNLASKQSKQVASLPGLSYPIRWLDDNTLILRVASASETADYVLSLNGGSPQKIVNVINASGANGIQY